MITKEELRGILDEIFEDEIYDMVDAIPQEIICEELTELNEGIGLNRVKDFMIEDFAFRVNNTHGGFVSCTNENGTGVSYTLYYAFPNDGEHEPKEMWKNLIDMMNEAWYACVN